jgi:hypothetical protein
MLFLDSSILQLGRVDISVTTIPIPPYITAIIGDVNNIRTFGSHYFNTVQSWMPIISKTRFYDHYLHPLSQPRTDLALLFLCMKLIISMPPEHTKNPQTPTYFAAKQFYLDVETAGIFSIQALQAGLLISLYELGHAIYPSAFLSIGACARYSYALGINGNATSQIIKPSTWVEQEETRRVWWAIVILDRFEPRHINPCSEPCTGPWSLALRSGHAPKVARIRIQNIQYIQARWLIIISILSKLRPNRRILTVIIALWALVIQEDAL